MHKIILSLIAAALCLTACSFPEGEDYLYYDLYGFADVEASVLAIRPEGMVFNVTEDKTDGSWKQESRIFLQCDVLRTNGDKRYDIRLKAYKPVLEQGILVKSLSDESVYGTDAACFYQDWGSDPGAYTFNAACQLTRKKDSATPHTLSLVFDDQRSHSDTLFFELHHQGSGESYENLEMAASDFQVETQFLTFDLSSAIPADAHGSIVVSFEWDWFPTGELQSLLREPTHYQTFGTLKLD